MHTLRSFAVISALTACVLLFAENSFSQNKAAKASPRVKLANVDTSVKAMRNVTYEQIFANPKVVCIEPGAEVTGFTISFQPKRKDYIGPFVTKGVTIADKQIALLKKLQADTIESVNMFIEDIHVKYKGEEVTASPLIMTVRKH